MRLSTNSFVLVALTAFPVLAGCLGPQGEAPLPNPFLVEQIPPEEMQPPKWKPGYEWHYRNENGLWYNWTVEGKEKKEGVDAYKITRLRSSPNALGSSESTEWLDARTLGVIAGVYPPLRSLVGMSHIPNIHDGKPHL